MHPHKLLHQPRCGHCELRAKPTNKHGVELLLTWVRLLLSFCLSGAPVDDNNNSLTVGSETHTTPTRARGVRHSTGVSRRATTHTGEPTGGDQLSSPNLADRELSDRTRSDSGTGRRHADCVTRC